VTLLALEVEAGSVDKAQKVDRASAGRQLAVQLNLFVNNILSAKFFLSRPGRDVGKGVRTDGNSGCFPTDFPTKWLLGLAPVC
jgi:hypothetical protein